MKLYKLLVIILFALLYTLPLSVYKTFNMLHWTCSYTGDVAILYIIAFLLWFFYCEITAILDKLW